MTRADFSPLIRPLASLCHPAFYKAFSRRLRGNSRPSLQRCSKRPWLVRPILLANFAGEGETVPGGLVGLENRFTLLQEGWVQLAPYGDHPKEAMVNGKAQTVLQRLDPQSVQLMVADFEQLKKKLGDKFGGLPFYEGHPDVPGLANIFTDRRAYGWIEELRAGSGGLDARVKWSETADGWIKSGHFKFYSPYWLATPLGNASPVLRGALVFRPVRLISAGLTNDPNIAVMPLANITTQPTTPTSSMNPRDLLCQVLGLPNTATDEQITTTATGVTTPLPALMNARTTAETDLRTLRLDHQTTSAQLTTANSQLSIVRTDLANARRELATNLVDGALTDGRLTAAERETTLAGFVTDFANAATALKARPKVIKTKSSTGNLGDRKPVALDNARARQAEVQRLVAVEQAALEGRGVTDAYEQAFANVEAAHPELFGAMAQPGYLQKSGDDA